MQHAISWFEIPALDFNRAKRFYETVLQTELMLPFPGMTYAVFETDMQQGEVGGGLVEAPGYVPSQTGPLIYLNGGEDLAIPLARIEGAGGTIVMPKTSLGGNGFMAHFIDSEGNKVALHSMK